MKFTLNMSVVRLKRAKPTVSITVSPNFSDHPAAPDAVKELVEQLAQPWKWTKLQFSGKDGLPLADMTFPPPPGTLTKDLQETFEYFWKSDEKSYGEVFASAEPTKVSWAQYLADVAREPGQVGRTLKLNHFFLSDEADLTEITPPVFTIEGGSGPTKWTCEFKPTKLNQTTDYTIFTYEPTPSGALGMPPGATFEAKVCYDTLENTPADNDPQVDFESLWIRFPKDIIPWSGDDWFASLSLQIANALDLTPDFTSALAPWKGSDAPLLGAEARLLRRMFAFVIMFASGSGFGDQDQKRLADWTGDLVDEAIRENAQKSSDAGLNDTLVKFKERLLARLDPDNYDATFLAADLDQKAKDIAATLKTLIEELANTELLDSDPDALTALDLNKAQTNNELLKSDLNVLNALTDAQDDAPARIAGNDAFEALPRLCGLLGGTKGAAFLLQTDWWKEKDAVFSADQVKQAEAFRQRLLDAAEAMPLRRHLLTDRIRPLLKRAEPANVKEIQDPLKGALLTYLSTAQDKNKLSASTNDLQKTAYLFALARLVAKFSIVDLESDSDGRFVDVIAKSLATRVAMIAAEADTVPVLGSAAPVTTVHPLVFTVGRVAPVDAVPVEAALAEQGENHEFKTALARVSGIGVLARIVSGATPGPWHCLTLGTSFTAELDGKPKRKDQGGEAIATGHAPWRIGLQNGLQGWTVTYRGDPLSARSILAEMNEKKVRVKGNDAVPKIPGRRTTVQVEASRMNGALPDPRWAATPALGYGRTYDFAFFTQLEGGALPEALSTDDDPGGITLPMGEISALNETQAGWTRTIRTRYLRRTPIGAPRLVAHKKASAYFGREGQPLDLPLIPRSEEWPVFPLVNDLAGKKEIDVAHPLLDRPLERKFETVGPIVLLVPDDKDIWNIDDDKPDGASTSFSFGVIPPSVAVDDYIAWVCRDLPPKGVDLDPVRKDISRLRVATSDSHHDNCPDDPAVTHFRIQLWRVSPDARKSEAKFFAFRKTAAPSVPKPKIQEWQRETFPVTIKVDKALPATADAAIKLNDVATLEISVPPGSVHRIAITTLVEKKYFLNPDTEDSRIRYLPESWWKTNANKRTLRSTADQKDLEIDKYKCAASNYLIVEAASLGKFEAPIRRASAFADKEAWNAKIDEARGIVHDGIKTVGLTDGDLVVGVSIQWDDDGIRLHAKRTTLTRQMWNWTGRSYYSKTDIRDQFKGIAASGNLPFTVWQPDSLAVNDSWKTIAENDGQLFGDRADSDSIVSVGQLDPFARVELKTTGAGTEIGPTHKINFELDRRAQYWRFAARIESRYVGLLKPSLRHLARITSPWRRLLIKARPNDRLPRLSVKFILPLTQAIEDQGDAAPVPTTSLLVLLDEPWGQHAGLAEKLDVDIPNWKGSISTDANPEDREHQIRPQTGYDPVTRTENVPTTASGTGKENDPKVFSLVDGNPFEAPRWPIGLTFDQNVIRPRPTTSCFELRLKKGFTGDLTDLMAQVRFRRSLLSHLVDIDEAAAEALYSEWTLPDWVSFPADARYWTVNGQWTPAKSLKLRRNVDKRYEVLKASTPAAVSSDAPKSGSKMRRDVYLLITLSVKDADGTKGEVFSQIQRVTNSSPDDDHAIFMDVTPPSKDVTPVGRLIEIEMHQNWKQLYKPAADAYDKRRIMSSLDATKHPIWDLLFPPRVSGDEPQDAIARIRRISPPLGV